MCPCVVIEHSYGFNDVSCVCLLVWRDYAQECKVGNTQRQLLFKITNYSNM